MKVQRDDAAASQVAGYTIHVANVGIHDNTLDFSVVVSDRPCAAAAVFTQSRFAGPSVQLSREHVADGRLQAIVTVSKNANVATGRDGDADAREVARLVADRLDIPVDDVLLGSTGVIGRRYPMDRLRSHIQTMPAPATTNLHAAAEAIMTTDTAPKLARRTVGPATIVGIAKGVGMMEPNMATLLAYFLTDADIDAAALDTALRDVVSRTFNCLSIDTDTSTSDTCAILANGQAGPVDINAFSVALEETALQLAQAIAIDGEGATKLLEVHVDTARNHDQARRVAKAIVNSPLVKTAVHGADPNWGRVAMAIGKCTDDTDIAPDHTVIRFGNVEAYPRPADDATIAALAEHLARPHVRIHVSLQTGTDHATVWGCDLSDGYVRLNADYTT